MKPSSQKKERFQVSTHIPNLRLRVVPKSIGGATGRNNVSMMRGVRCLAGEEERQMRARRCGGWQWGRRDRDAAGNGACRDARKEAESGEGRSRRQKKDSGCAGILPLFWSERLDSNQRPLVPNQVRYQAAPRSVTAHAAPEGVSFRKQTYFAITRKSRRFFAHGGTGAFNGGTFLTEGDHSIWSGFTPSMMRYS